MDIEGGSQTGYVAFLTALRSLMDGGNKQCVCSSGVIGFKQTAFHRMRFIDITLPQVRSCFGRVDAA